MPVSVKQRRPLQCTQFAHCGLLSHVRRHILKLAVTSTKLASTYYDKTLVACLPCTSYSPAINVHVLNLLLSKASLYMQVHSNNAREGSV